MGHDDTSATVADEDIELAESPSRLRTLSLPHPNGNAQSPPLLKNLSTLPGTIHSLYGARKSLLRSPSLRNLSRCLFFLLPSFVQSRWNPSSSKPRKIHRTAYLDGMRGVACLMVYLCHFSYQCFVITVGYGQGDQGDNYGLLQLPFIRLAYSGPPAVAVFFVISGYALSYKPIQQMRAKSYDALLVTLSSSTLRRPFRLFLPCAISTFGVFVMIRLGVYEYTRFVADDFNYLRHMHEGNLGRMPTMIGQWWDWSYKMFNFIAPFSFFDPWAGIIDYDVHLWTIPWEFRASMVLFLSLFAVARMKPWLRIATLLLLTWWVLHWQRWEIMLFWSGSILAEFDHMRFDLVGSYRPLMRARKTWGRFFIANFICGLYLMSYPDNFGESTPGYVWLESQIPSFWPEKYRFWQAVGAVQIVWATNNLDLLKTLFSGPIIQYLGKISYALYLMHGPVIHSAGYLWLAYWWGIVGMEPRSKYELGFFIGWCFTTITLIWVADIFERIADSQCVKFARWAEIKLLAD